LTGPHAIYRWADRGVKAGGQIIRLRVKWVGARLFTTEAWLNEFHAAIVEARANRSVEILENKRARYVSTRTGRKTGRPRKIDPNVRQRQIDSAREVIRAVK